MDNLLKQALFWYVSEGQNGIQVKTYDAEAMTRFTQLLQEVSNSHHAKKHHLMDLGRRLR